MKLLNLLGYSVGGALLVLVAVLFWKAQESKHGRPPGLQDGRLAPCSVRPNCVSSEAGTPADKAVEALPVGDLADPMGELAAVIGRMGGDLVAREGDYLAATFTSALFGFVDDFEARLDRSAGVIHVRSASRVGHSDLGANRTRVTLLRSRWAPLTGKR